MFAWFRRIVHRSSNPSVRPWALAGPLLVLMIAAPFVRPLFQPGVASDREVVALQSVRAVLREGTLAIDARHAPPEETITSRGLTFSKDPPVYLLTLAAVAWVIERAGCTFEDNPHLLEYLLIFFAITTPTAIASALLYRVGRVFELRRSLRLALGLACVLATGWISFSVVLLPHALAAALLTGTLFGFVQVILSSRPKLAIGWLFVAGFCVAGAAAIEPLAMLAMAILPLTVLTLPLKWGWRLNAAALLLAGMAGPVALHASITPQITGNLMPPRWNVSNDVVANARAPVVTPAASDDLEPVDPTIWFFIGRSINRLLTFTIGSHGMLSHFPVLLLGMVGAGMVVHRHWTRGLKWLAGGGLAILALLLVYKMLVRVDAIDLNFAAPRLIIAAPLVMVWAGAWLRRSHSALVWSLAGIALGVSILISLIGATAPAPPGGYQQYTFIKAFIRLLPDSHANDDAPQERLARQR